MPKRVRKSYFQVLELNKAREDLCAKNSGGSLSSQDLDEIADRFGMTKY